MGLMEGLFLTLINAVACVTFPKLLSVILTFKNQRTEAAVQTTVSSNNAKSKVPSFPY